MSRRRDTRPQCAAAGFALFALGATLLLSPGLLASSLCVVIGVLYFAANVRIARQHGYERRWPRKCAKPVRDGRATPCAPGDVHEEVATIQGAGGEGA